jgi:hypothetical protein
MRQWVRVMLVVLLGGLRAGADGIEAVRVMGLTPDMFPYRFMSVMDGGPAGPRLAFQSADGRTAFVRVGEALGPYTVDAYTPGPGPDTDATATLRDGTGRRVRLTRGEPLRLETFAACLVSLKTGGWRYVRDAETLELGGEAVVFSVTPDGVTASSGSAKHTLPVLRDSERIALRTLWERRRRAHADALAKAREAEAQARVEAMLAEAELPAPDARPAPRAARTPRGTDLFMGTEYAFPIEYEVLPFVTRRPDGTLTYRAVAFPTRFTTRRGGLFLRTR